MIKKIVIFLTVIAALLGIAQLYLCGYLGAEGIELSLIEKNILILETENRELSGEVAQLSSLKNVKEQAVNLGFHPSIALLEYPSEKTVAQSQ